MFKECYAVKIARLYKATDAAYNRNLNILTSDPAAYWMQVKAAASMAQYFRFHVSGDIPNSEYLNNMITLAKELKNTKFLVFTKQYQLINEYLSAGGVIPENLKVIFSNWGVWKCENPYKLPTCEVIFKNTKPLDHWKICGGNCTECACAGVGCWELKNNETIAIYKH